MQLLVVLIATVIGIAIVRATVVIAIDRIIVVFRSRSSSISSSFSSSRNKKAAAAAAVVVMVAVVLVPSHLPHGVGIMRKARVESSKVIRDYALIYTEHGEAFLNITGKWKFDGFAFRIWGFSVLKSRLGSSDFRSISPLE